jgi:all-trans-8'-apo-beta-carotenal 15,15'-oxygenase
MSDTKMSIQRECLSNCQLSFGVVNPSFSGQKNSFLYANVARSGLGNNIVSPPQGIVKFDCNQQQIIGYWMPLKHEFCGEPMFAPKSKYQSDEIQKPSKESEDEGYILSVLYNGKTTKSEMVILDSRNISAGPITRIPLGCTVPHGYFGYFVPSDEAAWTYEEIERRAKLADKVESRGNLWNEVKSDFSGLGLRLDDFEEYFGDVL